MRYPPLLRRRLIRSMKFETMETNTHNIYFPNATNLVSKLLLRLVASRSVVCVWLVLLPISRCPVLLRPDPLSPSLLVSSSVSIRPSSIYHYRQQPVVNKFSTCSTCRSMHAVVNLLEKFISLAQDWFAGKSWRIINFSV